MLAPIDWILVLIILTQQRNKRFCRLQRISLCNSAKEKAPNLSQVGGFCVSLLSQICGLFTKSKHPTVSQAATETAAANENLFVHRARY
jgi:hypothetical protein